MKGVYVFCGEEPFLIDKEVENIIKKHSNGQVIKYDLSEINVNVLLEDAFSISLSVGGIISRRHFYCIFIHN